LEFILRFYDACLRDADISHVAKALDRNHQVLRKQIKADPELQLAKTLADQNRKMPGDGLELKDYILERLSPDARKVWEDIQFWEDNTGKIDAILNGKSKRIKQELFIHALVSTCFDVSASCKMVGVSRNSLEMWKHDIDFRQMLDDVQWHRKNFFESALLDLVQLRNPAAVMFVNRTQNRDRGYGEKIEVDHTGIAGTGIDIDELDLDLDTRKKILEAVRRKAAADKAKPVVEMEMKQLTNTADE